MCARTGWTLFGDPSAGQNPVSAANPYHRSSYDRSRLSFRNPFPWARIPPHQILWAWVGFPACFRIPCILLLRFGKAKTATQRFEWFPQMTPNRGKGGERKGKGVDEQIPCRWLRVHFTIQNKLRPTALVSYVTGFQDAKVSRLSRKSRTSRSWSIIRFQPTAGVTVREQLFGKVRQLFRWKPVWQLYSIFKPPDSPIGFRRMQEACFGWWRRKECGWHDFTWLHWYKHE